MNGEKSHGATSLLKLQIGPVQEFIAQARSTRDLWSGSYLISWMMAHALRSLEDLHGSDSVIFPALAEGQSSNLLVQPLVRWLRDRKTADKATVEKILTPNLPNILLAIVPERWTRKEVNDHVVEPMRKVWTEEINACLHYYDEQFQRGRNPQPRAFDLKELTQFRKQGERFWQINWQLWSCRSLGETRDLVKPLSCPNTVKNDLQKLADDPSLLSRVDVSRGWSGHYTLVSHRLDARRHTRDFDAWPKCDPKIATRDKDSLSGREEAIADKGWLTKAREHNDLRYRFKSADQLGAPNLIKRVWDLAYLKQQGLVRSRISYDSVPGIAAAPWLDRLRGRLEDRDVQEALRQFIGMVYEVRHLFPVLPNVNLPFPEPNYVGWLEQVDAQMFHASSWEGWLREALDEKRATEANRPMVTAAIEKLETLYTVANVGKPGRYFAVLELDGDQMGAWVSGEKCPLTLQFHQDFSRALAAFSLQDVRSTIEGHHGQPIYAGGDDVLAMLPAETAVACANDLAQRFRKHIRTVIPKDAPDCTASVGVAMAHMRAPLQDVVAAAGNAERLAKKAANDDGLGRNALVVSLFKRSGETVQWGSSLESAAWPLLKEFQDRFRKPPSSQDVKMPISGGFPHILAERLSKQGLDTPISKTPLDGSSSSIYDIAVAEFAWVVQRQTGEGLGVSKADLESFRKKLVGAAKEYLDELAKPDSATGQGAPLERFVNLFSVEAFLASQGE